MFSGLTSLRDPHFLTCLIKIHSTFVNHILLAQAQASGLFAAHDFCLFCPLDSLLLFLPLEDILTTQSGEGRQITKKQNDTNNATQQIGLIPA
jgi:hypothetical protein